MKASPYQAYEQTSVTTATPGELTLLLYDGCLKFIRAGRQAILTGNMDAKNTNLQKAQRIMQELMATLNMDVEIAKNMYSLYDYINRRLIEANMQVNTELLDEVEGLVADFRNTWKQVIQLNRKPVKAQGGQV